MAAAASRGGAGGERRRAPAGRSGRGGGRRACRGTSDPYSAGRCGGGPVEVWTPLAPSPSPAPTVTLREKQAQVPRLDRKDVGGRSGVWENGVSVVQDPVAPGEGAKAEVAEVLSHQSRAGDRRPPSEAGFSRRACSRGVAGRRDWLAVEGRVPEPTRVTASSCGLGGAPGGRGGEPIGQPQHPCGGPRHLTSRKP